MVPIYEGDKSYVFISYSHKDTALVTEIMEELSANGVRIWYDAGIEAGSEWPENIGNHLSACGCVLCFISANYAASDNCRRELTFALSLKKPTVSIYLERCQLSAGLQLQLGLAQSLFCDQFSASKALADNIAMLSVLESCCVFDGDAGGDYTGTILKGQKQGQGTFTYTSGHVYSGDWVDNQRCGFGILSRNGQEIYKGMWKDDKYHGQGIYYHQDGTVYDGQWEDGLRCGQGKFTYADGAVYEGQWKNGQRHGDGTYISADEGENKRRYVGQWREDRMEGKGLFTFRDGSTYEGDFIDWKFEGFGVRKYLGGAVYEGQWKNSKRHDQGTYVYADEGERKRRYVGQWREDRMEGKGIFTYQDGSTYEGDFVNWEFQGYGIRKFSDGRCYDGYWESNKQNGHGVFTYADGKRWEGLFQNDKMWTGQGFLYYFKGGELTGKTYDGQLVEGKYRGSGTCHYENGAVYDGEWENGKRHGQGTYIYADEGENKRRYVGQWREDRMEGKGTFTFRDGSTYEGDFVDWKYEGYGIRRYANGCSYAGEWRNDRQNGQGVYTYEDGKCWEGLFRDDKMWTGRGFLRYYENGKLTGKTYNGQLLESQYHGEGTCVYEDGTVYDGQWENHQFHGQGSCEWTTTSDAMGPLVRARKEGTWIRNHMIEGSVEVYRRQMDGTFSLLSYEEGKLDYKGDFIGVVKVRGKRRTKTRLRIPGYPFRWPNWWILRITMEKEIWQFEGKDSRVPEGYGTAVCYDETIVEGHFLGGKLDETVACTVTYPNGAVYTGFTHNLNRHGQGILRDVDDAYYDGIWENDCFAEGRTERMAFGNGRYTGQLKNGIPHGEGTLVKPDGSSQSGIWKKGKLIQRT